jgi:hypothetical protein
VPHVLGVLTHSCLCQAEHLTHETQSWIVVAGQHPNSRSNFIHFTSAQLQHDALEQSSKLVTDFGDLVAAMIAAQ